MARHRKRFDAHPIRQNYITDGIATEVAEPEWCYLCATPTTRLYRVQGTNQPMPLCDGCAQDSRRQLELGE